ncbi:MAG: ligase-associated DNA damage response exonuclease [Gemmatimonadaceae bacterium]
MASRDLLRVTDAGLYCETGRFFIDPWQPVDRAVVTHAHSDHARFGNAQYLAAAEGASLLAHRLPGASIETAAFGESRRINGVIVSLHPAGHIRGSAQVRVEHRGEVWVVSGDYKRDADPTCTPFEPIRCDVFITEATFALPVYRWAPVGAMLAQLVAWTRSVHERGGCAILLTYTLGKAQRILAELMPFVGEPVLVHGAVEPLNALYREAGVRLAPTRLVRDADRRGRHRGALVLAPPSAVSPGWMRRFESPETAFASGWMRLRGTRRRRALDRGFAISDHADWNALLATIAETGASRVLATHGDSTALVRLLQERGLDAAALQTAFTGETDA